MTLPRTLSGAAALLVTAAAACAPQPAPMLEPTPPIALAQAAAPPPPDSSRFQQEILVEGSLDEPTEMAIARDGRVFWAERKGALKVYEPETGEARTVAELEVNHRAEGYNSENGFIGLALDPRFAENGWIYLNYTDADTLKHRLSRVTYRNGGIEDERVLLEVPITDGCCHTGGSMTWDERGNLLVSYGDNTNPFATRYAPIDNTPGRELWDAGRSSGNSKDLRGKILRITPQPDGSYTVPQGNLFPDPAVGRPEIYTMGHRNPYRISYDRRTGYMYWGEVGPDARADSIWGPIGYDEVNQARRAGNFGWPFVIADNQPYRRRDFVTNTPGEMIDPAAPVNESPNNTGARVLPPAQPAFIWYPYVASERFPLVGEGGRNAMAGPVYYAADFPGSPVRLPEYYDGKLIHYDWIRGWMRAVTMDGQGDYLRMEPFLDHLKFDHPSDVELGPDGSLYVLEYGTYWFTKNPNARLSRIVYHAGNRPPVAALASTRTVGAAPHTVEFSAAGSYDRDPGDAVSFTWTFADGSTATGATVRRTFSEPGSYPVRLTVRDRSGTASTAQTEVRVGNEPPAVEVAVEGNRSFFWEDSGPVRYRVEVRDREDGTVGRGIAPGRVRTTLEYLPQGLAGALAVGHQEARVPVGLSLMQQSDCAGCHATDQVSVGPSLRQIAERYAAYPDTVRFLARKIVQGGSGNWGDRVMPAHPTLRNDVAMEMTRYILSLAAPGAPLPTSGTLRLDRHKAGESGAYLLTSAYVDQGRNGMGSLESRGEVVLRAPVIRAGDLGRGSRFVGTAEAAGSDGTRHPIATVFEPNAHLALGRIDLTGVGRIRVGAQSLGHPFTVELREGSPEGGLLASRAVTPPTAEQWFTVELPVSTAGQRDLYLVLRSAVQGLGQWNPMTRLDDLRFDRAGR